MDYNNGCKNQFNSICKQNSIWCKNCDRVTRTKNLKTGSETVNQITNYRFGRKLGDGACGSVDLLIPIEGGGNRKAHKHSSFDLKEEFEIMKKWENKTEGLSIHPKAYLPSDGQFDNIIILHKYDKTLSQLVYPGNDEINYLERINAICQVSKGVSTLHSLSITHNDIYDCNIMYDIKLKRYDLIDFGRAKIIKENNGYEIIVDVCWLKNLIFMLLGGREKSARNYYEPTLKDIKQTGFNQVIAGELYDICQSIPMNALEINKIFTEIQTKIN